jgi:hypothetical protein
MTTLTVFLINVHAHLIFFEQDRFQEFQKKKTYCIFIAVHILLRLIWLKLFRTMHTITC